MGATWLPFVWCAPTMRTHLAVQVLYSPGRASRTVRISRVAGSLEEAEGKALA